MTTELDELRRLCDEAWPPPWEKFGNTVTLKLKGGIVHTITLPGDHQTLAFIAASRTAVPALLDRLAELERRDANYLTYGQGGASYWEAQLLDKLRMAEERAEQAEARELALRKAVSRTLNLKRRVDGLDPVDVCYVMTEHQIRMMDQALQVTGAPQEASSDDRTV